MSAGSIGSPSCPSGWSWASTVPSATSLTGPRIRNDRAASGGEQVPGDLREGRAAEQRQRELELPPEHRDRALHARPPGGREGPVQRSADEDAGGAEGVCRRDVEAPANPPID